MHVSYQKEEYLEEGLLPFPARLMNLTLRIKASTTKQSERCGPLDSPRPVEDGTTVLNAISQRSISADSDPLRAIRWNDYSHTNNNDDKNENNDNVEPRSLELHPQPSRLELPDPGFEDHLGIDALLDDPGYSMSRYLMQEPSRLTQLALQKSSGPSALSEGWNKGLTTSIDTICFKEKRECEQGMESATLVAFAGGWTQYVLAHIVDLCMC
jgi:hypothetical protein